MIGLLVAGVVYIYWHRRELGLALPVPSAFEPSSGAQGTDSSPARSAAVSWVTVDRPQDGFRLELPRDIKQIQLPAYNENGGTEFVNMIYANPDAGSTFSVAWSDNPPIVRTGRRIPDLILDLARDQALARTQTTLVSESRTTAGGSPGREFMARNAGGGVMESRLLYVGDRLYMLTATFPSMSGRREGDVAKFFNSFTTSESGGIPTRLPQAGEPSNKD